MPGQARVSYLQYFVIAEPGLSSHIPSHMFSLVPLEAQDHSCRAVGTSLVSPLWELRAPLHPTGDTNLVGVTCSPRWGRVFKFESDL